MEWTSEQNEIFDRATTSKSPLMIQAYAGCAKTTTLEELAKRLKRTSAIALAFGAKTVSELKRRLPDWVETRTANSLGHKAWSSAIGKRLELNENKLYDLLRSRSLYDEDWTIVRALVRAARLNGLVPSNSSGVALIKDTDENWSSLTDFDPPDRLIKISREVLKDSISMGYRGVIDYDDQIYLSSLFGGVFPTYRLCLLDEAQDFSTLNIRQINRSAEDRIIALGDRYQSIFAFRGADANSIDSLRLLRPDWIDCTLSVSFRCPRAVVRRRNAFLPNFKAALGNPEGSVTEFKSEWYWHQIPRSGSVAILSRNNAPLIEMSLKLRALGISCHILGIDGSKTLLSLAKSLLSHSKSGVEMLETLKFWQETQSLAAKEKNDFKSLDSISDKAESLANVISNSSCENLREVLSAIKEAFSAESGSVVLATPHRAKGLEYDAVVHLDPWRIPSILAHSPDEINQELNILNVIETRTKGDFITANVKHFMGI